MPEDTTTSGFQPDENSFIATGNIPELKSQLMMYKFMHRLNRVTGNPIVLNADQFRGTVNPIDKPKVTLFFLQKPSDVSSGYTQIHATVSFRLMDKSADPADWDDSMYDQLANKVWAKFGTPIFSFQKGKEIVTYTDKLKGYSFIVWCLNKVEGHKVIEQAMDVQGHSPDLEFENHKINSAPTDKYPNTPDKRTIRGKSRRKRRHGALGTVWFRYAFLTFPSFNDVIMLCDTSGSKVDPVLLQSPQILNYNVGSREYSKQT